jgi:sirohydrochlorin cobaltochelatase
MKKKNRYFYCTPLFVFLFLAGVMMNSYAEPKSKSNPETGKTAIVLVAFGSAVPQTAKTYEKIEQSFKKAFPQYPVSWAYTSETVIKKLRESGKQISNIDEAVKILLSRGYSSIVLQSLHIMPGEEYLSIPTNDSSAKIIIGDPLLASDNDIQNVAQILIPLCKGDTPTVVAAHGNSKYPELNKPLHTLASIIEKECPNSVLCTIEGPPGIEPMQKISASAKKINSVNFLPFMLIAGMHVQEDLTGPGTSSWKSILGVSNVNLYQSLGELSKIHEIFISHCQNALSKLGKK